MNPVLRERRLRYHNLPASSFWAKYLEPDKFAFYESAFEAAWHRFLLDDDFFAWYDQHAEAISELQSIFSFEDRLDLRARKLPKKAGVNVYLPLSQWQLDCSVTYEMDTAVELFFNKIADLLGIAQPPRPHLPD